MPVNNGTLNARIPTDRVLTLTGSTGVNVALTNPVNGAIHRAGDDSAGCNGQTTAGSIALVWLNNGVTNYSDASSQPSRTLGSTAEESNPASGWP